MTTLEEALRQLYPEIVAVEHATLKRAGQRGVELARETTLFNHGDAFNEAIKFAEINTHSGIVSADPIKNGVHYAEFLEYGTVPHLITAKNAKSLRFVVNGNVVFAKSVNHPGTQAYKFMEKAGEQLEQELPSIFDEEFNRIIKD